MLWLIHLLHRTLRVARMKGLAHVLARLVLKCLVSEGREKHP